MTNIKVDYEPGVYEISEQEYFAIDAASSSFLKTMQRSPAHAYQTILTPPERTVFNMGSAIHTVCLEPNKFEQRFSVRPEGINRRTNAGKAEYAAWLDANKDKQCLEAPDAFETLRGVAQAVKSHPLLGPLTTGPGKTEQSIVWIDEETGVKCKCRIDRLVPWPHGGTCILDLKSTPDATMRKIEYAVRDYMYHFQLAFYNEGADSQWGKTPRSSALAFVEKDAPHGIRVIELDLGYLEAGRAMITPLLKQYKKCKDTGVWPNYNPNLQVLEAPEWM